ncbi:hypothetical protein Q7P37_011055 [Cladosporium fusiforme]
MAQPERPEVIPVPNIGYLPANSLSDFYSYKWRGLQAASAQLRHLPPVSVTSSAGGGLPTEYSPSSVYRRKRLLAIHAAIFISNDDSDVDFIYRLFKTGDKGARQAYQTDRRRRLCPTKKWTRNKLIELEVVIDDLCTTYYNHARTARELRIAVAGESAQSRAERLELASDWENCWLESQNNPLAYVDHLLHKLTIHAPTTLGASIPASQNADWIETNQKWLNEIRARIARVPGTANDNYESIDQLPPAKLLYTFLSKEDRLQFWRDKWDDYKLVMFWPFRGDFDIFATFSNPIMDRFGREQFATMADLLWHQVLAPRLGNESARLESAKYGEMVIDEEELKQMANVYRNVCTTFSKRYNVMCLDQNRPDDMIRNLDLVMVRPRGLETRETRVGAAGAELRRLKNVAAAAQGLVSGT